MLQKTKMLKANIQPLVSLKILAFNSKSLVRSKKYKTAQTKLLLLNNNFFSRLYFEMFKI